MPRMTPEIFEKLPDELKDKIMSEVPASEIGHIHVIGPEEMASVEHALYDQLLAMDRPTMMSLVLRMVTLLGDQHVPKGAMPRQARMAIDAEIFNILLEETKEIMKECKPPEGEDFNEE